MRILVAAGLAACLLGSSICFAAGKRPAVLFVGGVHAKYAAGPLVEMGIDVDKCGRGKLSERLATGKYNVVVAGALDGTDRKALQDFLAKGGGALICSPGGYHRMKDWTATNEWLSEIGARPRWEVLQDTDKDNVARDVMGCALSWSENISPPVDKDVRGVLTLMWNGTTGCEPPMSFDLGKEWKVVVRGAKSMKSVPSKRHDDFLQPWIPKEGIESAPALMATREIGKGRIAVMAVRYYWLFTPPGNCPTAEAMLTAGAAGKQSDWLRVYANAFRWLAEPSMKAGMGGAGTPDEVVNPPVQIWEPAPPRDWKDAKPIGELTDQPQNAGLIGARTELSSGTGSVADYVKAAKEAGLQFIVFLEDSMKMDQAGWDRLVEQCTAHSGDSFAAIPGLTYEDAQGNHLYAFADQVKFPKPEMLLPDKRLATIQEMRSRAYFDYVNEYMQQKILSGFWRHNENFLHFTDYKLYNSFPIYSFVNGKKVDDALEEYRYMMGTGAAQAALAFEIMTDPKLVPERAKNGFKVVWYRDIRDLQGKWHSGAWSFHGMMSQYVTNGPKILVWQAPNRLTGPRGEWWRPDLWEFRVQIRARSDAGLRSVILYDGDRGVLRRWLPGGAKTFEAEVVLYNAQQLGIFPVVEDMEGRKAVGMQSWNRNCIMEEFYCSDRCNFLGNARLRTRDGRQTWTQVSFKGNMGITPSKGRMDLSAQPAVCLTMDSPTLPIDGRPMGFPTQTLRFEPNIPGELPAIYSYPTTYMVGPEIAVGQANYILGYDPSEIGAKKTPLGHDYLQPQRGHGNAWGGWYRLIPTRKARGWSRTYACNWIPETFRIGWHETMLRMKESVSLEAGSGMRVMYTGSGWSLWRGNERLASPGNDDSRGAFTPGTFATLEHGGGSIILVALDDSLRYHYRKGGMITLNYVPEDMDLARDEIIHFKVGFAGAAGGTTTDQMLDFARMFGVSEPGSPGYRAKVSSGRTLDTLMVWRLDGEGRGIRARIPRTDMPGFLPVAVEGLNDNWSVQLLDRLRKGPNHRGLPIRDGRAFAQIDLVERASDVFIGHPVTCGNEDVRIQVSWMEPGVWSVEAHNPTDRGIATELRSNRDWPLFRMREKMELAPGTSRTWRVKER